MSESPKQHPQRVASWKVRRGGREWTARALKVGAVDLAAAGINTNCVTVRIEQGRIVIEPELCN